MAQVTFTIPANKVQYFIDCYGADYDEKVNRGEIDGGAIIKSQYAQNEAFKYLAQKVKVWNRQKQAQSIVEIDITE